MGLMGIQRPGTRASTTMDSASGGRSSSREGCDIALLFRAHHGELVRIAVLMVRDRPTAEDVVQDVFASLHARAAKLPSCQAAKRC